MWPNWSFNSCALCMYYINSTGFFAAQICSFLLAWCLLFHSIWPRPCPSGKLMTKIDECTSSLMVVMSGQRQINCSHVSCQFSSVLLWLSSLVFPTDDAPPFHPNVPLYLWPSRLHTPDRPLTISESSADTVWHQTALPFFLSLFVVLREKNKSSVVQKRRCSVNNKSTQ